VTDVTDGLSQDGAELSAADEQLLRELTERGCSQGKPKRRNASSFDLRREAWRSIPAE
jgi:hypothetical protein